MSSITFENGALVVRTPYNAGFASALKGLPATDRKFDKVRTAWLVAPQHSQAIAHMIEQWYGEMVTLPRINAPAAQPEVRLLEVRYIGQCKDRGDGESTAFGWVSGEWSVIFPENILKQWFGEPVEPGQAHTLFGVLGIPEQAPADEIKRAYRRMSKQWHPDVCREPDAVEQFKRIQAAYEVLKNDTKRAKYLAGLTLERSIKVKVNIDFLVSAYRAPLRCGYILCDGVEGLGRFKVSKIMGWEDILDAQGRCLVTSWPKGADKFLEVWSEP